MFQFTVGEVFTNAPVNLISWIGDFLATEQGGKRVLYAASRSGGGVVAFNIDGAMTLADQISLSVGTALSAPPTLDLVSFSGKLRLVVSGTNQTTLLSYQVDGSDLLGRIVRPAGGPVGVISAQEVVTAGGQTWLYAATTNSGVVSAYAMAADGTLTLLQGLELAPARQGVNLAGMQLVTVGGAQFLAAALPGADGITLMRIGADGRLSVAAALGAEQGLGINDPSALGVVVAHGVTYLLAAAGASSSLTVIEVGADGSMTVRDHIADTLATRFQGVLAFDSFTAGGRSFVVLGGGDGGLDLMEILPDGRLIHLAQIFDTPATAMDGISAVLATVTGSGVEIFVGGEGAGITRLVLDLSALGLVRSGGNGADSLTGGAGDDLIWGGGGADVLAGGGGDDVLADGAGTDTLSGGAGADLFVLAADGQADVITDFQPGVDRLDLSGWGRIYDASTLDFTAMSWGARIAWGNEVLEIRSANGLPLTLAQLRAAGLFDLWHALALAVASGPIEVTGSEGADTLSSDWQDEVHYRGLGGNDRMAAGAQIEMFDGGAGRDLVSYAASPAGLRVDLDLPATNTGHAAGDTYVGIEDIYGSAYGDTLLGDAGANALWGADGSDMLYGGAGDDTLYGGSGADRLDGGAGGRDRAQYSDAPAGVTVDMLFAADNTGFAAGDALLGIEDLYGSAFGDRLLGDSGVNMIWGDAGDDVIFGRVGPDSLYGGAGNDILLGGAGADRLDGGEGTRDRVQYSDATAGVRADLATPATNTGFAAGDAFAGIEDLHGSTHADVLYGDGNANILWGVAGDDLLHGRAGADTLQGGLGNDTLIGGPGMDHFVFNTALGPGNVDVLADFSPADDTIRLENAVFTALSSTGTLAAGAFTAAAATTAAHRILYNQSTGQLFYDADGNGAGAAILFATLSPATELTNSDFLVI